jgi:hypothetical protein
MKPLTRAGTGHTLGLVWELLPPPSKRLPRSTQLCATTPMVFVIRLTASGRTTRRTQWVGASDARRATYSHDRVFYCYIPETGYIKPKPQSQ